MILNERDLRAEMVVEIARKMMTAARTAPKGKGADIIEVGLVTGEDIKRLSERTYEEGTHNGMKFFWRDAENILSADAVVLIGTRFASQGLNCFHCGYALCTDKPDAVPCALNSIDVGIALGSACATAADHRADTRIMFSVGLAAQKMQLLGEDCKSIFAIPVSASSKNPFFDRKPKEKKS